MNRQVFISAKRLLLCFSIGCIGCSFLYCLKILSLSCPFWMTWKSRRFPWRMDILRCGITSSQIIRRISNGNFIRSAASCFCVRFPPKNFSLGFSLAGKLKALFLFSGSGFGLFFLRCFLRAFSCCFHSLCSQSHRCFSFSPTR